VKALLVPVAVAATVVNSVTAQTPADSARPIRLSEAIRLAQLNSPADVQARGATRTSEASVRTAWGAFVPALTLNATTSYQNTGSYNATTGYRGLPWGTSNGLSVSLDVFDGLARLYNIRASNAQVNASSAGELSQRFLTALSVKQQFYAVLAAQESDASARSQLKEAQETMRVSVAKVKAATATKSDSLRSLIQVGNGQLAILTAQNDLRTANASLTRLIGSTFTVTASSEDTVEEAVTAVDSLQLEREAEAGPGVAQAQGQQIASRETARAARAPYFPTVSLSYGLIGNASDTLFHLFTTDQRYTNQFRLTFSYPIFNQFQREQAVVAADVSSSIAEANLRDARLAARQNLVQYLGALRTAEEQLRIQSVSVAAAEEDLRVQQQRYVLGVSTLLDEVTSEATLVSARAALIQARYTYRIAKAQLSALIGREL